MNTNAFTRLLAFLERLDQARISYTMRHSREEALMIVAFAPGEYWEIEFVDYGDEVQIEIERYVSNGHIDDESILQQLFAMWADEETPTKQMTTKHEPTATD